MSEIETLKVRVVELEKDLTAARERVEAWRLRSEHAEVQLSETKGRAEIAEKDAAKWKETALTIQTNLAASHAKEKRAEWQRGHDEGFEDGGKALDLVVAERDAAIKRAEENEVHAEAWRADRDRRDNPLYHPAPCPNEDALDAAKSLAAAQAERIGQLERELGEARADILGKATSAAKRFCDAAESRASALQEAADLVPGLKAQVEALSKENAALRTALSKVIAEVDFKLSGGDIPDERCGECGEYGAGMLRDAVKDAKAVLASANSALSDAPGPLSGDGEAPVCVNCGHSELHHNSPIANHRCEGELDRCGCFRFQAPSAPDPLSQETVKNWSWGVSSDQERFLGSYASEEMAIAAAASELGLEPGDRFWVGGGEIYKPRPYSADRILEQLGEDAGEECGEIAEDWPVFGTPARMEILEQRVHAVVMAWLAEEHDLPEFYNCEKVTEYTVPIPAPAVPEMKEENSRCICGHAQMEHFSDFAERQGLGSCQHQDNGCNCDEFSVSPDARNTP